MTGMRNTSTHSLNRNPSTLSRRNKRKGRISTTLVTHTIGTWTTHVMVCCMPWRSSKLSNNPLKPLMR